MILDILIRTIRNFEIVVVRNSKLKADENHKRFNTISSLRFLARSLHCNLIACTTCTCHLPPKESES